MKSIKDIHTSMRLFHVFTSLTLVILIAPLIGVAQTNSGPRPGLTPESPFYFLDRIGEAIQEFLAFNPEAKARLQVSFAAERIAEIKIILETKGVDAKGLEVAQSRLQKNISKAADIVENKKSKGENVSDFAKELDDKFNAEKEALREAFKEQRQTLKGEEKELKNQIQEARRNDNDAQITSLREQLDAVKEKKKLLEQKKDEQEELLEKEEERIEKELDEQDEIEGKLAEIQKEKQELLDEAAEDGVDIPVGIFVTVDALIAQAQAAVNSENYAEAKLLAEQAEEAFESAEERIENLIEAEDEDEQEEEEEEEEDEEENKIENN